MLNQRSNLSPPPKLSEVLFDCPEPSFGSLAALPSNVEAIEAALLFSAGMTPFVAIVGPSGWGKSHLMRAVSRRLALDGLVSCEPMSVTDYLVAPVRGDLFGPLVLDDVQEVLGKPRQRLSLGVALERRFRAGRPTILAFTAPKVTRQIRGLLPSGRDWVTATMTEPEPAERVLLLNQMANVESLALSPRLVRILALEMHGNGRTFSGALKRLRLAGQSWLDAGDTLRALGILDPFFADNSAWDLKMRILRIAEASRAQFTRSTPLDLALYAMLHTACLGEADVARAAGISPADAYLRAARFQKQMATCDVTAAYVRQFVEVVVGSLAKE